MATQKQPPKEEMKQPNNEVPEGYAKLDDDFGEKWEPANEGDTLKGTFLGIAYVPTARGSFVTHRIRTTEGVRSVAGAILERKMERIPDNTDVILVYRGKVKMKQTQGESRNYDVFYSKDTQLKAPRPPGASEGEYNRA